MEAAERDLLQATVAEALAGVDDGHVDRVLGELGWLEMLAAEPRDAVAIVFRALGSANATAPALDDVVVAGVGHVPRPDLAVLLPQFVGWEPPGATGGGLATSRLATARELLVVGPGPAVATAPVGDLRVTAIEGVDPALGLHSVTLEPGSLSGDALPAGAWETAVAWGRYAVAAQIAGACRAMLDLARTHALERVQFGKPVARFQAVRHRLADALVAVEALDSALIAVDPVDPMTAALAKAVAGRSAATVARHCQQILAGIGFTTDHPFHRYFKRTLALDGLFGSADAITLDLGRGLLATRRVPHVIEL
jgi:hypothetical protein